MGLYYYLVNETKKIIVEPTNLNGFKFGEFCYDGDYFNWDPSVQDQRDQVATALDNLPFKYKERLDQNLPTHSLYEAEWRKQYLTPKPIKWDMLKILDQNCWQCHHYQELCYIEDPKTHNMVALSYSCEKASNEFDPFSTIYFPMRVTWDSVEQQDCYEIGSTRFYNPNSTTKKMYNINECPCFTESQEYHDWKQQQVFLKVNQSSISL